MYQLTKYSHYLIVMKLVHSKIYLKFLLFIRLQIEIMLMVCHCLVKSRIRSKYKSYSFKNMLYDIKTSIKSSKWYYLGSQFLVMMYPLVKELTVIMFRFVIFNAIECGLIE
ncbi:hypothetical protein RFI_37110 [Reticulomyxa filosa]|uniref:Uncharacterized protein n=1 Tax=Reticulomyxa filosa TaxID=46433 RepID=X6LGV0_RETFI|nr:hypothetical protein RFI_37110 [Reticulomyxa filosa]|eukprot:ETO00337.1 hypothetical protein RFI_37110 [Reticulomyxa filosa]